MIGCHPEMASLPETYLFAADQLADLDRLYAVQPRFQHGLLRAIAEYGLGGQSSENIQKARTRLHNSADTGTLAVFRELQAWAAPRRLVEKSPVYVFKPEAFRRMERAFPDARYLHLARHPRGACESVYRTRQSGHPDSPGQGRGLFPGARDMGRKLGADSEVTPENMWLKPHLRILEFLEGIPAARKMFLRGEALVSEPVVNVIRIASWLGLETGDAAIQAMLRPENSPFARFGPAGAPLGNDRGFMQSPALRCVEGDSDDLEGPLSWDQNLRFDENIKDYAARFGY